MSGEPVRRTPSGRPLRLVGPTGVPVVAVVPVVPVGTDGTDGTDGTLALVLSPERQSVAVGRHWVVRAAVDAGVTGMANQMVELLTSELLANAVLHGSAGRAIHLWFHCTDEVARISVSDSVPDPPVVLHPGIVAPSGRGMAIVETMSNRWGVDEQPEFGKTVWFEIDLDEY